MLSPTRSPGTTRSWSTDAVRLASSGFHISLVEECTYDRVELSHKLSLFDMHHKYADVMKVDEVVAHLAGLSSGRIAAE